MAEVKLRLILLDVYKKPLKETVDIVLRPQVFGELKRIPLKPGQTDITGLVGGPQGRYQLEIDPPSYQSVSRFINLKASGITEFRLIFPVDPSKVTKVNFQKFDQLEEDLRKLLDRSDQVLGFPDKVGQVLYEALDDIRRAGMMNIATKCEATRLTNGRTVLSYLDKLKELRGDRFFVEVPKELREETKNSVDAGVFNPADQSLHHPPEGFSKAGSFKTPDAAGNLQLTFFMKGDSCVADIDIDDAGGFAHIFQVLGNKLSGKPTHPYNIHEILIAAQELDPGYTFDL